MNIFATAEQAIAVGSPIAWALIIAAGLVSAVGPCTLSRFAWLAADVSAHKRPLLGVGAFVAGTIIGYMLMGLIGSALFDALFVWSRWIYYALAIATLYYGLRDLWNYEPNCDHKTRSTSMTFLSGIGFAFLFQPCCTPIVVAILTLVHNPALAALYLAVYGFAHATPAWLTPLLRRPFASERFIYASTFITGGVSLAIGTYFILVA